MAIRDKIKSVGAGLMGWPPSASLSSGFRASYATIFMLHRVRDDQHGIHGFEPSYLRDVLTFLRRSKVRLVLSNGCWNRRDSENRCTGGTWRSP